jgi:Cdc6-like AAA superfamily ATPase
MDPRRAKRQLSEDTFAGTTEVPNKRLYILSSDTGTASEGSNTLASQAEFHGSGIQHSGRGNFNVRGNVSITTKPLSNSEKAEKCIRQLFLTDPSEDRDTLKRKKGNRADGTCEWIIGTDELTAWLSSEKASMGAQIENVLWLHGNPGTGKSTTAIFLTEELSKRFSNIEGKTLTYFFCDASFEQRKTATSIIRGLLFQLVQAHRQLLLTYVLPQYEERGDKIFTSFNTLWKIFVEAAADHSTGQKYCIIDALDECDKDSQEILLHQLRETFYNQHSSPPNIRIIITSRPYPEIQEYLEDFIHKDLASFDQTRQDIDRCIKERVDELAKKKRYTVKVKEEVSNMLREKAEGTFLWVGLACEELRGKPSKDAIRFLTAMPKGLTSLYRKLLEMVVEHESNEGDIIRRILGFVAVSVEVLGLLELSDACQLNEDEQDVDTRLQYTRDLIASCRLLVVIQDAKVQLLHQSVRDFLVGDSSSSFINRFGAHADAAYRCVDVLIEHFHNHNKHKGSQSFLKYATHNWPAHARAAQDKFRIHDSQKTFFKQFSPCMESWLRSLPSPHFRSLSGLIYEYYPPKFSLLHVAAWWGLPALVEYALEKQTIMGEPSPLMDVNCVDAWGATPLEWAVESAHTDTFDILLQRGANVGEKLVRRVAWKRNGKKINAFAS